MTQTSKTVAAPSDEIDLSKLIGILFDAKWLLVAVTFASALVGVAIALLSPQSIRLMRSFKLKKKALWHFSHGGDMGELFSQESSATTEIEIIKSRMILGDTVDKFNLTTVVSADYMPLIGKACALIGTSCIFQISRYEQPKQGYIAANAVNKLSSPMHNSNTTSLLINMGKHFSQAESESLLRGRLSTIYLGAHSSNR
ncbi:hypothetical protein VST7929_03317 [Vibrio stylophorae]|uniref:Polysaccharide chain length determinant N-terminal domain-containing protein n=1 Tax=Vibrio stylophorae TaxID=659351 RepID=A0ABN8DXL4_9VIBR|nr:Wzz/FepE/Etk N-terminal domain-containing protein [Vibrio stylophorae]CAH0536308.1 hypothetical protein VST7929_03317 [Vibrio stylophorae]